MPSSSAVREETPLPWRRLVVLSITLVNESLSATMIMPFVGLMVAHIENKNPNAAGYESGFLVGLFQLAQVVSSRGWGIASDHVGRKPVMQLGLILSAISMLIFGASGSIGLAMVARFFHGLGNGNIAVAKTVIGEITDKTNEAKGFATISFSWGIGSLLGPAIGGMLYDPCTTHPDTFLCNDLFREYPALLPCLLGAAYSLFAFVVAELWMEESNVKAVPVRVALDRWFSGGKKKSGVGSGNASSDATPSAGNEASPVASQTAQLNDNDEPHRALSIGAIFRDPEMRSAVGLYVVICGVDIVFWETFPLWAIASRDVGGLGTRNDTIGGLIMLSGLPVVLANLSFHHAQRFIGDRLRMWRINMVMWTVVLFTMPIASSLPINAAFGFLVALLFVRQFACAWSFGLTFMFIARVAPPSQLGTINGTAQSAGSCVRTVLPMVAGPIFAISVSSPGRPFPVNAYLIFLLQAVGLFVGFYISVGFNYSPDGPVAKSLEDGDDTDGGAIKETSIAYLASSETILPAIAMQEEAVRLEMEELSHPSS